MPLLKSLDHLVLTVKDLESTRRFYCDGLGMQLETFHPADGSTRSALKFGDQKINLHIARQEFEPKAAQATPGSADLCFLSEDGLDMWQAQLEKCGIVTLEGPVQRSGATGPIRSLYCRDPDGNLIEISILIS